MPTDPLQHRAHADAIVKRAADQLHELLVTVAGTIDPFPEFPGSFFTYGIEVEPPGATSGDIGCIVLGEDGELYELQIGLDPEQMESRDPLAMRAEDRVPLDLSAADYVVYATAALDEALRLLESREQ